MIKPRTGVVSALDVGSSKICCFVALAEADGEMRVIGSAHRASTGIRNGRVVDFEAAQSAILKTVATAEKRAGERVERIVVNLSAHRFRSHLHRIEMAIDGHQIGDADIRQIRRRSLETPCPEDLALLHSIPVGYGIDGYRGIHDPRGMYGEVLGAQVHQVAVAAATLRNLQSCVAQCHLEVGDVVVSPYASGLACLVDDEKEMGATLVDMGGGTTTIASFLDGEMVFADTVPVGANHVTRDIACGLSTPLADAERMKILYGEASAALCDDNEVIDVPLVGEGAGHQVNHVRRSVLAAIVEPRVEETFELVRERLDGAHLDPTATQRVVITGGGAQLQGIRASAERALGRQVRIGRPLHVSGLPEANRGPAFSTCAGLLHYSAEGRGESAAEGHGLAGPFVQFGQWLKELSGRIAYAAPANPRAAPRPRPQRVN